MMPGSQEVSIADQKWLLLADRGVYWPTHDALLVADPHFGKDASFRAGGIPIPRGSTDATLARIANMLALTAAGHLIILGDMFHTRSSLSASVCRSVESFFHDHRGLVTTLVVGNHDQHVGRLPKEWPVDVIPPGKCVDRIMLSHLPTDVPTHADLQLCGHLHPAISLGRHHESSGPLPCFFVRQRQFVLPAVGAFTGTYRVRPKTQDRIWMIVDQEIVEHDQQSNRDGPSQRPMPA